jgi:hypothetical protein
MFVRGIAGICGFCPTRQPLARDRAFQTRTYLSDDLPLHKQSHRCMQAICVSLHVKLEVVLRLLPLSNASATPMVTSKVGHDTFSSRCWSALFTLCSDASVRGPYRRVSCTPCAFAGGFEVCLWRFCCRGESILARRLYSQMVVNCGNTRVYPTELTIVCGRNQSEKDKDKAGLFYFRLRPRQEKMTAFYVLPRNAIKGSINMVTTRAVSNLLPR